MSEQDSGQVSTLQRPTTDNREDWIVYWKQQGQPWRTEPEINADRQKYLTERRNIKPDIKEGAYSFKDVKLNRADVEWLLATHENGRGPVDWSDETQREREGLDLRGADLRQTDLQSLPLARLCGGLKWEERYDLPKELLKAPIILLEKANLSKAHLEDATLTEARMQKAILREAYLDEAALTLAHLEKADLRGARMRATFLTWARLRKANLDWAHLRKAEISQAHLEGASLLSTHLNNAILEGAHLEGAFFEDAHMEGSVLTDAYLEDTRFLYAVLADKNGVGPRMANIHWGDVNLAFIDWTPMKTLGDEYQAKQKLFEGKPKEKSTTLIEYSEAVRAYRQLAVVLRNQGLNEDAARFAYRAQLMQRKVFWHQGKFGQYLFSLFLDLLAGYGYRPRRSFLAYLIVIIAFASAYYILGRTVGPILSPLGSVVLSMTSFHGRGFFPGGIKLDDPITVFAALEAFVGLLIEVTFIATLTQRLFGK